MKKFILSLGLSFVLLSSLCSATALPDRTHADSVDWVYGATTGTVITFYYAPSLTNLSPQGRLETWTKTVVKDPNGKVEYMFIEHDFVKPTFDEYKVVESLDYDSEGNLTKDGGYAADADWKNIPVGTPFEDTLQLALQYAKNN